MRLEMLIHEDMLLQESESVVWHVSVTVIAIMKVFLLISLNL